MNKIAKFEKVSKEQFIKDMENLYPAYKREDLERIHDEIRLPQRATTGSAGYDFYCPIAVGLIPGMSAVIPTGIRVKIEPDWVLCMFPRSGMGFKYRMQLENTVGIIDEDYYSTDNEGHIMIKVHNGSKNKELQISRGTAFAQGIFLPYGVTVDDNTTTIRTGGFGSTGGTE